MAAAVAQPAPSHLARSSFATTSKLAGGQRDSSSYSTSSSSSSSTGYQSSSSSETDYDGMTLAGSKTLMADGPPSTSWFFSFGAGGIGAPATNLFFAQGDALDARPQQLPLPRHPIASDGSDDYVSDSGSDSSYSSVDTPAGSPPGALSIRPLPTVDVAQPEEDVRSIDSSLTDAPHKPLRELVTLPPALARPPTPAPPAKKQQLSFSAPVKSLQPTPLPTPALTPTHSSANLKPRVRPVAPQEKQKSRDSVREAEEARRGRSKWPRLLWRSTLDEETLNVVEMFHERSTGRPIPRFEVGAGEDFNRKWSRRLEKAGL